MNAHFVYSMAPTGTVHLVEFDRYHTEQNAPAICGRGTDCNIEGDETLSGFLATCSTCKQKAGNLKVKTKGMAEPETDYAWEQADEACAWVDTMLSGWEDIQARVILRRLRDHIALRLAEVTV